MPEPQAHPHRAEAPPPGAEPLAAVHARLTAPARWSARVLALLGAAALALCGYGLHGLVVAAMSARTREIGVRMALGADARALRRSVVLQALRLTGAGLVIGAAGSWGLVRLMGSFLYGVAAYDPFTYAAVAILFTTVAVVASYLPARRATQVDPMVALRHD